MASTNVLFYFSLTFRSSHYVSSALDLTYLLVHLHTIEIIVSLSLSLSLSLSFSTHVCIAFNFICNMHSVCLKHLFPCIHPLLVLFFGNRRLCTYVRMKISTLFFQLLQTVKWRVYSGLLKTLLHWYFV